MSKTIRTIKRNVANFKLSIMRKRMMSSRYKTSCIERIRGYSLRITDGPNYYIQYKDVFFHQIYRFDAQRTDPLILDCGSNIGMSILYFKYIYPESRIIGFEPDPKIFRILQENITGNGLDNVKLVNVALGSKPGYTRFLSNGSSGGLITEGSNTITVKVEMLSTYLDEPVDFLKLNIEGQELDVLKEIKSKKRLSNVKEMVLEYHGWAGGKQLLGNILNLLDINGFRYLVHDFDYETCANSKPPFRLTPKTNWFCLVYAQRG